MSRSRYTSGRLYGKELFSVYPDATAETRTAVDGKIGFSGGFSVYLNSMRTSSVRCDSDFRTMDPFAENNGAAKISGKEPRGQKNFGEKFLGVGIVQGKAKRAWKFAVSTRGRRTPPASATGVPLPRPVGPP